MSRFHQGPSGRLSRRTILRGLGVTMALPWLECMTPKSSQAAAATLLEGMVEGPTAPVRLAFIFLPNGVNYDAWAPTPGASATDFTLSQTLQPLSAVRQHLNVITGLTLHKARANGDGPGDHARSAAAFLTGAQPRKTAGNDIRTGVSVDQLAAASIGRQTRLPSLELGCEYGPSAGGCDSGYSCAYSNNISWRDESTPMAKIVDPAVAFERLFGDATQAAAAKERLSRRQSILDFVLEDAQALASGLGAADRRKLDQYQTSVRELEQRIQRARAETAPVKLPNMPAPLGIPDKVTDHMDMMYDLLHLAFLTDATRVSTFMMAGDGSNRTFPEIGIKEGHHHLSHHQNNPEMVDKIQKIDQFHIERFARFLNKLASSPEGEGNVLDHTLVLYGGGISDGNRHNHEDLPIILAGRGGSPAPAAQFDPLQTGRLIQTPTETPLCNLYLSMLQRAGCPAPVFADSTGPLSL
jgi:hypothetical protein